MKIEYILLVLLIWSCNPKDAMFSMMSNIKTYEAVYENNLMSEDTIQMGFQFHKPLIDSGTNKPFRVLTKSKNGDARRYELRSIQFDTSSWMEHVELLKQNNSSSVILTEHDGTYKEFNITNKIIPVYKQTFNRSENPKENYSEFYTIEHGLILTNDSKSSKKLIKFNGKNIKQEIEKIISQIKLDTTFYKIDTVNIFETWEEKY